MTRLAATVLIGQALAVAIALTVVADMTAHRHTELLGGVNIWGYRGPVMTRKAINEVRIATVGGDLAFGWGVAAGETTTAALRQAVSFTLDRPGAPNRRFTAVNLGAMGLSADGYAARLERFGYLMPDVVCVLFDPPGPRRRPWMPSDDSAVTAATGYVPLLPLVVEERHRARPVVAVAAAFTRVDRQLFRLLYRQRDERDTPQERVDAYGSAAARAASGALDRRAAAVVVLPPDRQEADARFHRAVADALQPLLASGRVALVDLGAESDLFDSSVLLDGVNLSAAGHSRLAARIAPAVLKFLQ
jgi:hypothetical protein